ncbi:hypothetical protein OOZ54_12930 [Rhodopseudomonas palustris]|uniref:hypothetical protein n=1 Tax=Rhodopseudomonas palustris TaxID=1076 RepID=UPI0022F12710|nr:hypothetical protein [Rhodopseudomonas palustris]WBU27599.1 hypothetical protein OOZ54_12930 [Rhodopseudomonas palustris]
MLYVIPDDAGRITQANKIFEPTPEYEGQLRDAGHRFVTDPTKMIVSPDEFWVHKEKLRKRPDLSVLAPRRTIKAGGAERAVLHGVPKAALVTLTMDGVMLYQGTPGEAVCEFALPLPGLYRFTIDLWPARLFVVEFGAVA